jgi:aconitate hydratase
VGGANYGQGSSREHAALAPRFLGLRAVLAKSIARIHWHNLVNFGVLPLTFADASVYDRLQPGDRLRLDDVREQIQRGKRVSVDSTGRDLSFEVVHNLSKRQVDVVLAGGLINLMKHRLNQQ